MITIGKYISIDFFKNSKTGYVALYFMCEDYGVWEWYVLEEGGLASALTDTDILLMSTRLTLPNEINEDINHLITFDCIKLFGEEFGKYCDLKMREIEYDEMWGDWYPAQYEDEPFCWSSGEIPEITCTMTSAPIQERESERNWDKKHMKITWK